MRASRTPSSTPGYCTLSPSRAACLAANILTSTHSLAEPYTPQNVVIIIIVIIIVSRTVREDRCVAKQPRQRGFVLCRTKFPAEAEAKC